MNKLYFKKFIASVFLIWFLAPVVASAQVGNHLGEQKFLVYRIEYLDPLGVTIADMTGITYKPFSSIYEMHEGKILPEQYFGRYPLYFTGGIVKFRVFIKNEGNRSFRNLKIETFQEFLNTQGGNGEALGDNNHQEWFLERLGPKEEVMLSGKFNIPMLGESGIDQTHLLISHNTPSDRERGEIILEDFQAGLWCPISVQ